MYTFLCSPFINFIFYLAIKRFSRKPLSWVDKEKLGLAQYYIVNWAHGSSVGTTRRTGNSLNMSTVFFEFSFQRRTGFFLLQVNSLLWLYKSCLTCCCRVVTLILEHMPFLDLHPLDADCILFLGNILANKNRKRGRDSGKNYSWSHNRFDGCNNWIWREK